MNTVHAEEAFWFAPVHHRRVQDIEANLALEVTTDLSFLVLPKATYVDTHVVYGAI